MTDRTYIQLTNLNFAVLLFVLVSAPSSYAQYSIQTNFDFAGVMRNTRTKAVIPGLHLRFRGPAKEETLTNANGEFKVLLARGDYELTVDEIPAEQFRAFIKIGEHPSPDFVEFSVDIDSVSSVRSANYPDVTAFELPKFPPAAHAVRAHGSVQVSVTIDNSGSVTSAKALTGHPLLIVPSIEAAKKFAFQPSDSIVERLAIITFVFLPFEENNGQIRYSNQYRVNVIAPKHEIDY